MELTAASPQGLVVRSKQPAWTAWTRKRSAFNAWTSLGDLSLEFWSALPAYCSIDQHCTLSVHLPTNTGCSDHHKQSSRPAWSLSISEKGCTFMVCTGRRNLSLRLDQSQNRGIKLGRALALNCIFGKPWQFWLPQRWCGKGYGEAGQSQGCLQQLWFPGDNHLRLRTAKTDLQIRIPA